MDARDVMPRLPYRVKEKSWIARLAAARLGVSNVAIVIGHTIYLYNTTKADFMQNTRWLKHELCHIRQYEIYGIAGFIIQYLWEWVKHGYRNNRFEIEARKAEEL